MNCPILIFFCVQMGIDNKKKISFKFWQHFSFRDLSAHTDRYTINMLFGVGNDSFYQLSFYSTSNGYKTLPQAPSLTFKLLFKYLQGWDLVPNIKYFENLCCLCQNQQCHFAYFNIFWNTLNLLIFSAV